MDDGSVLTRRPDRGWHLYDDCEAIKGGPEGYCLCSDRRASENMTLRSLFENIEEARAAKELSEAVAWIEAHRKISAQVQMRGSWDWIALAWPNGLSRSVAASGNTLTAAVAALREKLAEKGGA